MMRFNGKLILGLIALSMATLSLNSCKKLSSSFRAGEDVNFTVESIDSGTKASYSQKGSGNYERIDWQENDMLRIYCAQASTPDNHYSDYKVTSVITPSETDAASSAHVQLIGDIGLRWGENEDHTFYATFPSPDSEGITKSLNKNAISAKLSEIQGVIGEINQSPDGNWTAEPDLKNMLMTAKANYNPETGLPEDKVILKFTPITTAIKFCIKNDTGSNLKLTDVQLISGNKKISAEPVLSGEFSVDLDKSGIKKGDIVKPFTDSEFTISYNLDYPLCSSAAETSTDQNTGRTLTISVGTDMEPLTILPGKTLTFTFFLNPVHDYNDLTFKLIKAGGSWMSTRLGYTDGSGIFFPRHKKSYISGLLVPEGAQWYVSFEGDITPWAKGEYEDVDLEYPEIEVDPIMTAWEEGEKEEIEMQKTTE